MLYFDHRWLSLIAASSLVLLSTLSGTIADDAVKTPLSSVDNRAQAIIDAFKHTWKGYTQYAAGHDEIRPVTNTTSDTRNGWGASVFDGLDTIIIMELEDEYKQAIEIVKNVNWKESSAPSKTFETNIRYLGGLLSAYDLRHDQDLLDIAVALAENVIMPAYNTSNGIPAAYVDVQTGQPVPEDELILAEFGSLQLELTRLSQLTGNNRYADMANDIISRLGQVPTAIPGLYPIMWSAKTFRPTVSYSSIAGGGDSYYEYLLKTNILLGGEEETQLNMWKTAVESMYNVLRSETAQSGSVFLGEIDGDYKLLQSGELVCFMPGNLLLGARYLNDSSLEDFATELMLSCYDTWVKMPTGIAPETWSWIDASQDIVSFPENMQYAMNTTGFIPQILSYDLRPETIESLFYFYRLTGDTKYQDMAWTLFEAIEKYCKTPSGFTRIGDVTNVENVNLQDFEESYFFAETLKYLYLIFADPNTISLDEYVLNTEAHPFKLAKPIKVQAAF